MDDRPSVAEGATFYDVDRQCRMKYVAGEWQRMPDGSRATDEMVAVDDPAATDPTVLDILRAHEWDRRAGGCACGWSQALRDLQLNHPYHVMHMLKTRSLYYPPAVEFSPEWGDSFRWDRPLRWK